MIITVESGLQLLKTQLQNKGYQVYYDYEKKPSDVFICSDRMIELTEISSCTDQGIFFIQANRKSIDQIIHEIEMRTYTPIFS